MKTKKIWVAGLLAAFTWLVLQGPALAQVEDIGPILLVDGQPIWWDFDNEIPPNPDFKILEFLGEAFNDTDNPVTLDFQYDFLGPTGEKEIVLPGTPRIVVPPGGAHPVSPGPVHIADFCPPVVSLHVESDGPVTLTGQFRHICVPIPEPSTVSLVLAGSCLCLVGRRRRR